MRRIGLLTCTCLLYPALAQKVPQAPEAPEPSQQQTSQPDKAVLQNLGKPMRISFQCTEDDMQWAGLSCTEQEPCPVYLEISSIEAVGSKIFAVGNIHSATMTLYSVLLSTEDNGKTWREPFERMRGVALDHIQFADFEVGWISGQSLAPLPRDPFLLVTTDGGKTWRQRNVFSESRAGSVQQFWFDSRTNGMVLIDRSQAGEGNAYELYESPNGGESWMLREVSDRPIRMKRAAAQSTNPDWRVRPVAASKSFRIEKRGGERWNEIASFLVPIASCKPPERLEAEPPPEPAAAPEKPSDAPLVIPGPRKPPSLRRPPR